MKTTTWTADRLPTRDEALRAAVDALSRPDEWLPPEAEAAATAYATAWIRIAELAPADPPARVTVMVGVCQHSRTASQILPGGSWLHIPSLGPCDAPPFQAQAMPS